MQASGPGSTEIPACPVPAQSDHSPPHYRQVGEYAGHECSGLAYHGGDVRGGYWTCSHNVEMKVERIDLPFEEAMPSRLKKGARKGAFRPAEFYRLGART